MIKRLLRKDYSGKRKSGSEKNFGAVYLVHNRKVGEELFVPYSDGDIRTVFTPRMRFYTVNLADPAVSSGLDFTLRALRMLDQVAGNSGIKTLILIIPTKESAYYLRVKKNSPRVKEKLKGLFENEKRVREIFLEKCSELSHVICRDLTPEFQKAVDEGVPLYFDNWDGHLSEAGHQFVAHLLLKILK